MWALLSTLFRGGGQSVVFGSDYPLAESVERLRAGIVPPGFDAESTESAMGTVTQNHVRLIHNLPWPDNPSDRPYFVGAFQEGPGGVVLSGRFHSTRFSRHVDRPKLSERTILLLALPVFVYIAWQNPADAKWLPLLLGFSILLRRLKARLLPPPGLLESDVAWLTAFIADALTRYSPAPPLEALPANRPPPQTLPPRLDFVRTITGLKPGGLDPMAARARRLRKRMGFHRRLWYAASFTGHPLLPISVMPYRICKTLEVENGHMLSKHPDKCRFPHGHTRKVELVLEADELDPNDMVCDFKAVKAAVGEFLDRFDHAMCMNVADPMYPEMKKRYGERIIGFEKVDPTTEVLAKIVFDYLHTRLADPVVAGHPAYPVRAKVHVVRVRVWETSSSWAEYARD